MDDQMTSSHPSSEKSGLFYGFVRLLANLVFTLFFPVRFHHIQRLQRSGSMLLISNHVSNLDPPLLAAGVKKREVTFLAKKELGNNPFGAWIMKKLHPILVDRHSFDMAAMRGCLSTLKNGHILGVFPEGSRHKRGLMEEMEEGVPLIALRSGAPLVPVLITRKPRLFRLTHVYVGADIPLDDLIRQGVNKDTCQQLMERMKCTYDQLMEHHLNATKKGER